MPDPLAYFITFTTYGTWLHGRDEGSVDAQHNVPGSPFLAGHRGLVAARQNSMSHEAYFLDETKRNLVLKTIHEVVAHRHWEIWAVHVRTNHVHVVVTAPCLPEKIMSDFKAWSSRRLRESFHESADVKRWTEHGSTRYLNSIESVHAAIEYVLNEQGEKMACHCSQDVKV